MPPEPNISRNRSPLVQAVIQVESAGDPRAVNPRTGAAGLMQVMEETARQPGFGVAPLGDRFDPDENVRFGSQYLDAMISRFGDERLGLMAFNAGPGKVERFVKGEKKVPGITDAQDYADRVLEIRSGLVAQAAPPGFKPAEPPKGFKPVLPGQRTSTRAPPPGFAPNAPGEPGIGGKVISRFLGTDVEDPLPLERMGSVMAGGITGAVLGSRIPPLPPPAGLVVNPVTGAVTLGAVGTLAGAVAPETTMEVGEFLGIVPEGTREKFGLSPEDLRTLAEGEVLLDLVSGGAFASLRLVGRGTSRVLAGVTREGRELAEIAARQDIMLLPVQVGKSQIARGYVAVIGRIPLLGGPIKRRGQAAEDALQAAFAKTPERFAPLASWSEISDDIFRDASNLVTEVNRRFGRKYDDLWARADELGIRVVPQATLSKADDILARIARETPVGISGQPTAPGKAVAKVRDFIENEVLVFRATEPGVTGIQHQSYRQMDGLLSKIDQEIATLEPGQRRFAIKLFNQLRQAAQVDALTNVRGAQGDEIARALRELDADFSKTISQLFETATAKRFGSVRRRGLRAIERDEATRIPVDDLARVAVRLQSPQSIDELSRLVTPETFNRITARVFGDAAEAATVSGGFSADKWAKHLGLVNATSNKRRAIDAMLRRSGSPLTVNDLDDLVRVSEAIASVEIPNVSSFLARRASISGFRGMLNGVTPGLAMASTTGGATWLGGGFLGFATAVGGGQLVSRILSKPESARALKTVLDREATNLVRKQAWVDATRIGLEAMQADGLIDAPTLGDLKRFAAGAIDAMDAQFQELLQ